MKWVSMAEQPTITMRNVGWSGVKLTAIGL
jgi:hypothetical protein